MEPLDPLDRILRGPSPGSYAERLRSLLGDHRLVAAAIAVGVAITLVVVAAASPAPPELSLPSATSGRSATQGAVAAVPGASVPGTEPSGSAPSDAASTSTAGGEVVVHVAGSVASPGLVRVRAGARVADAVVAAGGATEGADVDRLNLAALVVDASRLYVPAVGELEGPVLDAQGGAATGESSSTPGAAGAAAPAGPIDLNTATAEQLDSLPGVGPATAASILAHRDEHGRFLGVDELQDVRGIGPAKFDALRDLVTAGG